MYNLQFDLYLVDVPKSQPCTKDTKLKCQLSTNALPCPSHQHYFVMHALHLTRHKHKVEFLKVTQEDFTQEDDDAEGQHQPLLGCKVGGHCNLLGRTTTSSLVNVYSNKAP